MRQEHWWDNILWILIFIFVVPSSLVVASWGSLPGSRLYAVKLLAEDAMIAMTISKGAKSELQVAYADKRLSDATQLLSQNESGDGLEYFRKQMEDAKVALSQAPDGSAKEELKAKYLTALQNASHQRQQKQIISTAHNLPSSQTGVKKVNTTNPREVVVVREVTKVNYVTQVNQVTQVTQVTQVIQQIDQTQSQITEIIEQVQQQSSQQATSQPAIAESSPTPVPTTPVIPTSAPVLPAAAPPANVDANSQQPNSFSALSEPNSNNSGKGSSDELKIKKNNEED
jgi:5-bromo-4-chloroindolyl phosphate hydrolysis protein